MEIILSNVNNLGQSRYAAAEGFYGILFNFCKNDENENKKLFEIAQWTVGPRIMVEFNTFDSDYIFETTNNINAEIALLPYDIAVEVGKTLGDFEIYARIDINKLIDSNIDLSTLSGIVVDIDDLQNQFIALKSAIAKIAKPIDIFLNLKAHDLLLIENVKSMPEVAGLLISGAGEIATGLNDFTHLDWVVINYV